MREGMGMREIVEHGRRKRVTNYGDAQETHDAKRVSIFSMRGEDAWPLLLTVQCVEFKIAAGGPAGDFRPMVRVKWGHGATDVETDIDVTFRQRFPVVASTIEAEAFIGTFPFPGQPNPTPVPVGSFARFRAFVGEGLDGLRPFASRWVTQIGQAQGLFVAGQARLASVRVFNPTLQGAAEFFLLFDKGAPPVAGDIPFDGAPVPPFNALTGGLVSIPMGETRAFVNGIAWGMSSTAFLYTPTNTAVFVAGELEQ